jgi:nitrate/nitrite transporter NarK
MSTKQIKQRAVVFLVCLTAALALLWLFSALNSPDAHLQQLALKLLSLGAVGALLVMSIASLSRLPEGEVSKSVSSR